MITPKQRNHHSLTQSARRVFEILWTVYCKHHPDRIAFVPTPSEHSRELATFVLDFGAPRLRKREPGFVPPRTESGFVKVLKGEQVQSQTKRDFIKLASILEPAILDVMEWFPCEGNQGEDPNKMIQRRTSELRSSMERFDFVSATDHVNKIVSVLSGKQRADINLPLMISALLEVSEYFVFRSDTVRESHYAREAWELSKRHGAINDNLQTDAASRFLFSVLHRDGIGSFSHLFDSFDSEFAFGATKPTALIWNILLQAIEDRQPGKALLRAEPYLNDWNFPIVDWWVNVASATLDDDSDRLIRYFHTRTDLLGSTNRMAIRNMNDAAFTISTHWMRATGNPKALHLLSKTRVKMAQGGA